MDSKFVLVDSRLEISVDYKGHGILLCFGDLNIFLDTLGSSDGEAVGAKASGRRLLQQPQDLGSRAATGSRTLHSTEQRSLAYQDYWSSFWGECAAFI